jgi:hypothetical protein
MVLVSGRIGQREIGVSLLSSHGRPISHLWDDTPLARAYI